MEGTHIDPLFHKANSQENRVYIKSEVKPLVLNVLVCGGFCMISYHISPPQQGRSFMSREFSKGQRAPSSSLGPLSPVTKLCITGNGDHPLTFLMELIDLSHRKYFSQTCSNVPGLFHLSICHNYVLDMHAREQWLLQKEQD